MRHFHPLMRSARKQHPATLSAPADPFDLGASLGRWQAFGLISGRCSLADVESLRAIRNRKIYRSKCRTWAQFCARYLGLGRAQIDRLIQHLDEFGPDYFHLAQIVRLSPQTFRAISHAVRDGAICSHGKPISISPENAASVRRAVLELSPKPEPSEEEDLCQRAAGLIASLDTAVHQIARLPMRKLEPKEADDLIQAADRVINQLIGFQQSMRALRGF